MLHLGCQASDASRYKPCALLTADLLTIQGRAEFCNDQ